MPTPRALLTLLLLVPACSERPSGDTETGTTSPSSGPAPGTDSESSAASVGSTTPGPTSTTAIPPTTGVTTDDTATTVAPGTTSTTDDTATTVVDPSDTAAGTTTSTTGVKLDLPAPWPAGLVGCNLDAPPGTMVSGDTQLGTFTAQRAYFGWWGFDDHEKPTILFVSPEADPAVEVDKEDGSSGAIYVGDIVTEPLLLGGWIGSWDANLSVRDKGMITFSKSSMTIVELAGNWDAADPADPPRLVGTLNGPIAGPVNAVFCDQLVHNIFPE